MATERKERRSHPRVHLAARVEVEVEGRSFLAVVKNISAGGMLIYTANPGTLDQHLHLNFALPESEKVILARAVVRHVYPDSGMGVQFEEIADEDRAAIRAFVQKSHRNE